MPVIHIIPILRDNYCYIVEGEDKRCLIVDAGQVSPVSAYIDGHGLIPTLILNTHHHADHVAGNAELKARYGISVIGPKSEMAKIPHIDKGVVEGDMIEECGITLTVIATPGHTMGHIVFYASALHALFAGDTIFSMGCGRLLEGSAEDMFSSLQKINALPAETLLYCGHEYTESNGRFAQSVEPDNRDIDARMAEVIKRRANDLPSLPVTLESERKTNPFLRADTAKKFAELRLRKDQF